MKNPPIMVVQFVHILGPLKGEIQEFTEPVIAIGRHPSCQIRFPADLTAISRKHAEITREGNQFKLVDQSANGTFVNGKRVKETYLKTGDVLAFAEGGPKVSVLIEMREGQGQVQPPPSSPPPSREFRIEPPRPTDEKPVYRQAVRELPEEAPFQAIKVPLSIQYGPTIRSFKQLPVTIGKNPRCDFILDHPAIFDQHAQIFFSQNQYWIKDLTGQKSVKVNRQPISFQASLKLNDEVALSHQGPLFRFLGEGRFAEVTEPRNEASIDSSVERGNAERGIADKKGSKGIFSKIKKLVES